jgi:hypothetical protein
MKKKKVAIVGFAPHYEKAPFDDPEFEIWTVNNLHEYVPRQDRIFQLHQEKEWLNFPEVHLLDGKKHFEWLKTCGIPVYMVRDFPEIPTCVVYPLEKMKEEFYVQRTDNSGLRDSYFTNTISFALALAISEGFKEIHVYGVDMSVNEEYKMQKASCEYFLGIAQGRGIDVRLPPESDLLKARFVYGFEEEHTEAWDHKIALVRKRLDDERRELREEMLKQQQIADRCEGGLIVYRKMEPNDDVKKAIKETEEFKAQAEAEVRRLTIEAGKATGAISVLEDVRKCW